jgi:hypothetical protein
MNFIPGSVRGLAPDTDLFEGIGVVIENEAAALRVSEAGNKTVAS